MEHWIQIFVGSNNLIDEIAPHHLSSECFIILEDSPKANNVLNKFDFGIKYQVLPLPLRTIKTKGTLFSNRYFTHSTEQQMFEHW